MTPRDNFKATGAKSIRKKLNELLKGDGDLAYASHKPCEQFSFDELNGLQHDLLCRTDKSLLALNGGSHPETSHRAPAHTSTEALERHHARTHLEISSDETGAVARAVRDGRCHAVAMSWVHHISSASRCPTRAVHHDLHR